MKGTGMPMRQAGPDYRDSVLNFTRGEVDPHQGDE
jgi:hypothetical protein